MADPARASRLASRVKVIIAEALRRTVKDDRAEMITITDARVTNDLQHATIYYTVLADTALAETERAETALDDSALADTGRADTTESAAGAEELLRANHGLLRRELGRQLNIRLTPTVQFVKDEIPESAAHLEDLLRKAREQDEAVAARRENAKPVNESPYRTDADAGEANAAGDRPSPEDR